MGLFDFFSSPKTKCEKEMYKILDDIARVAKESVFKSDTFGAIKEDDPMIVMMIMSVMNPALKQLKEERQLQKAFGVSDEVYDNLIFTVSNNVLSKYIPNWNSMLKDSLLSEVKKEQKTKAISNYKLLYFISRCDDPGNGSWYLGTVWAKPLIERQNQLFRQDPPLIPMESIVLEDREDLTNKYNVGCFPCVILIDKEGNKINEWKGNHITGTMINKYMQDNSLS